jgi:hypothetical protein
MAGEKTALKVRSGSARRAGSITSSVDFWIILLVPAVAFNIISVLYNFLFYSHWHWVVIATLAALVVCFLLIALGNGPEANGRYLPLGISGSASVLLGAFLGLYCYDTYGIFVNFYTHSRTYTNVVPSEPSASVADAGRLIFTDESTVDGTKSVGYAAPNGKKYCIAPVHDFSDSARVEFWAVGMDCCGWESEFSCDASTNPDAHGGIVVFDNMGLFNPSNRDWYILARKKAEAEFDLVSVEKPIYVRWVENDALSKLSSEYQTKATTFLIGTVLADLIVCAIFAYVFVKNMKGPQLP